MFKSNSKSPKESPRFPTGRAYRILVAICSIAITAAIGYLIVWAGSLTPSAEPGSTMHSLDNIYSKIDANKTEIDLIRGTDLPGVITEIDANETKIDAIIDTHLPALDTKIDANKAILDILPTEQLLSVSLSDTLLASADTERGQVGGAFTKYKEIIIPLTGYYRITFEMYAQGTVSTAHGQVWRNELAHGTDHDKTDSSYETFSDDLFFAAGDRVQLRIYNENSGRWVYIKNFRVKGTVGSSYSIVIID